MMDFSSVKAVTIPEGKVNIIAINGLEVWRGANIYLLKPADGTEEGEIPCLKLATTAGMEITITFFLTKKQGYLYDGRNCGLQYLGSVNGSAYPLADDQIGVETSVTIHPQDGTLAISGFRNDADGVLAANSGDRLYGRYVKLRVKGG